MPNGSASADPQSDAVANLTATLQKSGVTEAERILKHGKPFDYFIETFKLDHEGDLTAARCMALVFAASAVANGDGLHCYLSGNSGRGKSHAAETMFRQLPERFRYDRAFSDKYLYYAANGGGLKEGAVIMVDDQTMSDTIQEIFKVAVSHYRSGVKYGTVMNQKPVTLEMPQCISWVLLKVDDPGDDQVMNRLIQARIDEGDDKIRASAQKIQEKYIGLDKKKVKNERQEVIICQHMWGEIKGNPVAVDIPCAGFTKFHDYHNLRNHELFFNLIMSHAVIHQFQRETIGITTDEVPIIRANKDDFKEAKLIFEALYAFGGQRWNTLRSEDTILNTLLTIRPQEGFFTVKELAEVSGLSDRECRRALNGRKGKGGDTLGGLLQKCPYLVRVGTRSDQELEFTHTYSPNSTGNTELTQKRTWNQEVYHVDMENLECWKKRGYEPVWLEGFEW